MRYLLFALLLIPPVFAGAQTRVYVTQDQPQQIRQFRGGVDALNYFRFPVQGGHSIPAGDSLWFVRVNPGDGQLYMWNGLSWGCMTCGGSGIVDSNLFVTLSRLRDSLLRVQQTLNDSSAALRGDIPDISGLVPQSRTITINGSTQDLSANRSWTIPVPDTSILRADIDANSDSILVHRADIDGKEPIISAGTTSQYWRGDKTWQPFPAIPDVSGKVNYTDTSSMLNPYLRKGDTTALLAPYLRKADTANMLSSYTRVQRFLDSISAVRSFAGTKQNQLNGTGFVKASGMTISYDNSTYTPTGRTITINGISQDLSANRSWTISTSADSSIFETRYGADTAKANIRLSLADKLENITGLIQQGTNVTITGNGTTGSPYVISSSGGGGGGGLDTAAVSAIVADSLAGVIRQGGNSFGDTVKIGSNDNFPIGFRINNGTRFRATNWFTNYGLLHPSQNTGIVFVNNSLRFPSSGDFIFYPGGSASANVMRYTTSGLAIGYVDGTNASAKLDVNGSALINGGTLEVKGNSASTGYGLLVENSSGEDILKANNDRTIQIEGYSGSDTALIAVDETGNLLRKDINSLPFLSLSDTTGKWLSAGTTVTNWSGASTGLNAATGRTSLGGTTVGQSIFTLANPSAISFIRVNANNTVTARSVADTRSDLGGTTVGQSFFTLTNPSAITFPRINANNTVSALSASDFRTAIGAGTGNGTVTSVGVSVPTGFSVSGSPVTSSGTVTISYAAGYQGYTSSEASKLSGIEAGADVTDATNVSAAGAIMDGDFSANGLMTRTASGTYTSRSITGTTGQISVSNGDGTSGNPTLSLHSDVTDALDKAATALQPEDTVDVLFTKNDARIIRRYVDNCTSCTLTVNDHRTILRISNSSPVTLYVPSGLQSDFEVLIEQAGTGKITITGLSGVAIGSFESAFTTKGTYATATLYATEEEDEYTLTGNLE